MKKTLLGIVTTLGLLCSPIANIKAQDASEAQKVLDEVTKLFQKEFSDGEIHQVDVDYEKDSTYTVSIDAYVGDKSYEIDYRSQDGKLEEIDREEETTDQKDEEVLDFEKLISLEEANELALAEVDLTAPTSWTLDSEDDGAIEWEIEFDEEENQNKEASVTIDAASSDILEVEQD
ncbi:PepSY domain-containing protein [Facklamia sp. DSM 111018]|uniref:PepSY domain-containing protein n=1 Tax=Facklamia lactis TaxID=2749967 RepID=A0ABS0LS90_9LACT|nr:PepSY domain-containing protein [Facklamia lactis]MBG9987036.1 PepSY domain-containing protein [Facklamia lactis]